jgi:IS30 family transposase
MCVSCVVQISSTYIQVKLSPQQAVEAYRCVSCEVRTSSAYKQVKLSQQLAVEPCQNLRIPRCVDNGLTNGG